MEQPFDFRPFPLLSNPHIQTIVAATVGFSREPPSATRIVPLPDGDAIALEVSGPPGWDPRSPTVVMIHGLSGCHRSPYLVRLAGRLLRRGVRAVRMNLRGCGSGAGLARRIYHSGRSEDVLAVLEYLAADAPASPLALVGFSLGGNIALKLAGELGEGASRLIDRVIAVCPPADLALCARRLQRPENRIYDRYFVHLLVRSARERYRRFPDLGELALPERLCLWEFDELYTAPQGGFLDAEDYYARASAKPLVSRIAVASRILFSEDDPLIASTSLDGVPLSPAVEVTRVARGGHLGFLGSPLRAGGVRWLDWLLERWLGLDAARRPV